MKMEEISPAVAVLLFLEDFTRENPSIRKGAKYFTWQKRYDSYEVAYSIVGATVVELLHGGYIDLEVKRGLLRKSVLFTRKRMIPKKYGVMGRGFNAISEYNPTPLNSALFLIFPISRFPAAYLGTYIVEKELKGKDPEELRKDSEMIKYKEELKVLLEDLKRNQPELWEGIKKEVDKACQLVKGKQGYTLYSPLDMLEDKKNENKN
ncbi:MAG TPA: hypothetical protein ENG66_06155 [Thermococcus sp.]|nr:hypothetical protein [Thermococcus sp.]RLF73113.1 MAG: hypothetical protein DRN51_07425 [Thermococci archaeon]RLF81709.1 MAG: hypothetical protein DRN38_01850 [Thermococci archaeon]RLF82555.1 MAG: hypothetical protein DRN48_08955 [Thermococci archaeon]RLF86548.1 MAG: hypothetical protein DRN41_02355 [Thermococci archaeon]